MYQIERKNFRITDLGNSSIFRKGSYIVASSVYKLEMVSESTFESLTKLSTKHFDYDNKVLSYNIKHH